MYVVLQYSQLGKRFADTAKPQRLAIQADNDEREHAIMAIRTGTQKGARLIVHPTSKGDRIILVRCGDSSKAWRCLVGAHKRGDRELPKLCKETAQPS